MVEPRTIGNLVIVISTVAYVYYTFWVLITPLINEDNQI